VEDENDQGIAAPIPRREPKSIITDKDLEEHYTFGHAEPSPSRA
jgi:hypothetical protein